MKYLIIIISFILISCNCKSLNADYDYFNINEFQCKDGSAMPTSVRNNIENKLKPPLNKIRAKYNKPMSINSGYRSVNYNASIGGVSNSEHLYGLACDVSIHNGNDRFLLTKWALYYDVRRVGISNNFIHIGVSTAHPQEQIWIYGNDL